MLGQSTALQPPICPIFERLRYNLPWSTTGIDHPIKIKTLMIYYLQNLNVVVTTLMVEE